MEIIFKRVWVILRGQGPDGEEMIGSANLFGIKLSLAVKRFSFYKFN
jgi:hypothetical protein